MVEAGFVKVKIKPDFSDLVSQLRKLADVIEAYEEMDEE